MRRKKEKTTTTEGSRETENHRKPSDACEIESSKKKKKRMVFPGRSDGEESACNAGDQDSVPGWGRSPGEENGNPLQHFCLKNPTDRGAWL